MLLMNLGYDRFNSGVRIIGFQLIRVNLSVFI